MQHAIVTCKFPSQTVPCSLGPGTWSLCNLGLCLLQSGPHRYILPTCLTSDCWGWEAQGSADFSWQHNPAQTHQFAASTLFQSWLCHLGTFSSQSVCYSRVWSESNLYTSTGKKAYHESSPQICIQQRQIASSNHLFKLALFILSSSNYQWLCLSLAFLFHCDLETTRSISTLLLSFLNTICNFLYLLPHPPCLQAPPPVLAHKHIYIQPTLLTSYLNSAALQAWKHLGEASFKHSPH